MIFGVLMSETNASQSGRIWEGRAMVVEGAAKFALVVENSGDLLHPQIAPTTLLFFLPTS